MKKINYPLLAAFGSLLLMLGALYFQYFRGLPPCKLCIYQRIPHIIAIGLGLIYLVKPSRPIVVFGILAALTTSMIGFYHAGVEIGIFAGPDTCTSNITDGQSAEDLLADIMQAPVTRCDDVLWSFLGLSMAAWNGIISLGLAGLWALGLKRPN